MMRKKTRTRMEPKIACVSVACAVLGAATLGLGGCAAQKMSVQDATATPLTGWDGLGNPSRAGDYTFGGQPDEAALRQYADEGGAMVIDLRTHEGRDTAGFDEAAAVTGLGMRYTHLPVSSSTFSAADVDRFAEALRSADGPVLVHCGSSNRVGGVWAAYLVREQGWDAEAAIEAGKAAGMRSESVEEAARRVMAE